MTNYKGAQHLAVGTYVAALYQGSWYPGRIIRFDAGDVVVVRRTTNRGSVPETILVDEGDVRVVSEKNFGKY
ncbi:hypothetical protein BKD09_17920 [Bradyrhizobium japonicum]|uniref:DUF3553 domain-containing protein n=1 Tax=Bradyrhizobium japonicum TaxID=375 RepID=A0A1L3FA79_BRAJP|nr:hypothetical protein [Bradyrhizobium japonicum]APG10207.1 hypothetical protein BKD09_17920 [Bradyrhizobium japonicum]